MHYLDVADEEGDENEAPNLTVEDEEEYKLLRTRVSLYKRPVDVPTDISLTPIWKTKRNTKFMKCEAHFPKGKLKSQDLWMQENTECTNCFKIDLVQNLPNGVLPKTIDVLQYLLTIKAKHDGQHNFNSIYEASMYLALH